MVPEVEKPEPPEWRFRELMTLRYQHLGSLALINPNARDQEWSNRYKERLAEIEEELSKYWSPAVPDSSAAI